MSPYSHGPIAPKLWAMAKKTAIAYERTSTGKISLTVRYTTLAPADAKKKITHQQIVCPDHVEGTAPEQEGAQSQQQDARKEVGPADHLLAPYRVEEPTDEEQCTLRFPTAKKMKWYPAASFSGTP